MANTCFTSWFLVGPKADVKRIYEQVALMSRTEQDALRDGHRLDTWPLYTLLKNLGVDGPGDGDYRMEFINAEACYETSGEEASLLFISEDAWGPKIAAMGLLKKAFPEVRILFSSEEDSMGYFFTNDKDSVHFTGRHVVDANLPLGDSYYEYFKDEKELVAWVNGPFSDMLKKLYGETVNADGIRDARDIDERLQEIDEDAYFYVYDVVLDESAVWLGECGPGEPARKKTAA